MLTSNKLLLATAILAITLTACDKKDPAKTETAPVATTATSTTTATTVTKTAESTTAPISTVAPVSSVAVSGVASVTPVAESAVTPTVETTTTKTEIKETATVASSTPSVKFPATATTKGKSIVTQAVKVGTPEATVKSMMDAMMTGTPQQVASYYGVDDPTLEPMIEPMLAEQQPMVQQQAKSLQLGEVEYNKDKTKAIIVGKMTLNDKTTKQVGYKLQKIDGQWKLMP